MTEFISDQTANVAHKGIKSSLKTRDTAQQCAVLWFEDILNRQLYRELGYSSINQYAKMELGFSKSHTGEFLSLCQTFKRLPKVKVKVSEGKLPYTSARVLGTVMDESNQDDWLRLAEGKSRRELAQEVKRAKQEATDKAMGQASLMPLPVKKRPAAVVPVRVNMEMSPTQFARYEKLWEQIRKQRNGTLDKVETMLELMESHVTRNIHASKRSARADLSQPAKPPVQIHIHQCPDCSRATVQSNRGELEISPTELERAQCDCQISEPKKRNKASIPPAIRRSVLSNARHRCQSPGCDHTQFLEVHHIVPRRKGGTNDYMNLKALCSACHKLHHDINHRNNGFWVKEPDSIYSWDLNMAAIPLINQNSIQKRVSPYATNLAIMAGKPLTAHP